MIFIYFSNGLSPGAPGGVRQLVGERDGAAAAAARRLRPARQAVPAAVRQRGHGRRRRVSGTGGLHLLYYILSLTILIYSIFQLHADGT